MQVTYFESQSIRVLSLDAVIRVVLQGSSEFFRMECRRLKQLVTASLDDELYEPFFINLGCFGLTRWEKVWLI